MVQTESVVNVCDNSGALKARCIHVYGGSGKQKYASVGDIVMVSAIKVSPNGKIKKGEKHIAVVVRVKSGVIRNDGSSIKSLENSVVLLNKQHEMLGTRVFGAVFRELKSNPSMLKIVSLSFEVL